MHNFINSVFCRCTDKSNDVHITATESVFGEFYGVVIVLVFTFRINDPTISEKYYERNDNQMITRNESYNSCWYKWDTCTYK